MNDSADKKLDRIENKIDRFIEKQQEREIIIERRMTKVETKIIGFAAGISLLVTGIVNTILKKL